MNNKLAKSTLAAALLVAGALASAPALAWHHARVGVFVGGPLWYPYYPYPYYAYPPTVVVREAPPTQYIEQSSPDTAQPQQQGYWYYCADSKAYYPYVKDCPAGWLKVAPQSQPGR